MAAVPVRLRIYPRDPLPSGAAREEAREHAQRYRAYAEGWYQSLKLWTVEQPRAPVARLSYGWARGDEPITTLGEGGPDRPTALVTPVGQLREVEVARLISSMAASPVPDRRELGLLLERVRGGGERVGSGQPAPVSLLREGGGWAPNAPRMAAYAVACLTLAVAMGDGGAEGPLVYAGAVMRRGGGGA